MASAGSRKRIALYGHFDGSNFGNDSTLQAMLYNLRRSDPGVELICICTGPAATAAAYGVATIPIYGSIFRGWMPRRTLPRLARKLCGVLINEPYQWLRAFCQLRGVDMLVVVGTGLLTDAYGLTGWGPYNVLKWSLLARLRRCELAFLSIGAGPVRTWAGRQIVRTTLRLATFWSCRDESTASVLRDIGVPADASRVCPDLAFSLPEPAIAAAVRGARPVVGLGVMHSSGIPGSADVPGTVYANYMQTLARFAVWLLDRGYDIRLMSGDVSDTRSHLDLRAMLDGALTPADAARLCDPPIASAADVLAGIAACDLVVATRFHNVVLSLLSGRPVVSVSFHHKCASLMQAMGLAEYCLDIGTLDVGTLVERFCRMERSAGELQPAIRERTRQFRERLDRQYQRVFAAALARRPVTGIGDLLGGAKAGP